MLNTLSFIVWNAEPTTILGLRWYSLCWLGGLLAAYLLCRRIYQELRIKPELFEPLFVYCFVGVLIGARLGHCLFYQPDYFLSSGTHFLEMLLPMRRMADGSWHFTGYEGLASHGGVIGIMVALIFYVKRTHISIWRVLDVLGIAAPATGCFIRIGNLMNSEIIGKATDVPWAVIFARVDPLPRHPGQVYEALAYALLFLFAWALHRRRPEKIGTGFYFGLCLTWVFTARFLIEFTKEVQESFEASLPLDMGQLLSLPFIALGVACMMGGKWMRRFGEVAETPAKDSLKKD